MPGSNKSLGVHPMLLHIFCNVLIVGADLRLIIFVIKRVLSLHLFANFSYERLSLSIILNNEFAKLSKKFIKSHFLSFYDF